MNMLANVSSESILDPWADRAQFWLGKYEQAQPARKKRKKEPSPLILTGHGLSIRLDKGTLLIREGNTHYPTDFRERRFFKGGLDLPPRIVLVDGSGDLTLDALDWLAEQNIPLIRLRWDGHLSSVFHGNGYAADAAKAEWQSQVRTSEAMRVEFALPLITQKIRETIVNLEEYLPGSTAQKAALQTVTNTLRDLKQTPPKNTSELLGIEGKCAAAYFRSWNSLAITWKNLSQHPVPQDWLGYASRSSLTARKTPRNIRATHPVNAMLNYAYGVLESQTRIAIVAEGYDPTKGIVHGEKASDRHTFVFDRMEPGRPLADRWVLEFIRDQEFTAEDFTITSKGTCRLNPELARLVASSLYSLLFADA